MTGTLVGLGTGVSRVCGLLEARSPRLGRSHLVCIDGPAGSGKTTTAAALEEALRGRGRSAAVVHLDDLYDGWDGLAGVGPDLRTWVLDPWSQGRAGRHPRYDWVAGRYAAEREVPVADVLVVEGVGAGHPGYADLVTVLVWVEADRALGRARGIARDGPAVAAHWARWTEDEDRLHARERTRERAEVLVDGTSGTAQGGGRR